MREKTGEVLCCFAKFLCVRPKETAGNDIGYQGAAAFADALKVNKTLTSLELDNNGIGDSGAQALGEALRVP
eukprot:g590.t1